MPEKYLPPRRPDQFTSGQIFRYRWLHSDGFDGMTDTVVAKVMAEDEKFKNHPLLLSSEGQSLAAKINRFRRN